MVEIQSNHMDTAFKYFLSDENKWRSHTKMAVLLLDIASRQHGPHLYAVLSVVRPGLSDSRVELLEMRLDATRD